jgi:hypothetical protein
MFLLGIAGEVERRQELTTGVIFQTDPLPGFDAGTEREHSPRASAAAEEKMRCRPLPTHNRTRTS